MRTKTFLWLAAAVLLAFVPYRAFLSPLVPMARDLPFYFYPLKAHLAEPLRGGALPWIDRFRWGGAPLLAHPGAAAFDPLNVLFLFLPLGTAMKAWMLARLALGVCGFALFARRRSLPDPEAAFAGLLFGLSGVFVSLLPFVTSPSAFSLLPWFALACERVLERPTARRASALALAAALIAVAGAPEFVLYAGILAVVLLAKGARRAEAGRQLGALALAALLAAALAAPALLSGVAAAARSTRGPGGGLNLTVSAESSLAPARLPELLRDGAVADWSRATGLPDVPYPYLPSITPGAVGLLLALAGLLAGRAAAAPLFVSALGVLLALGPATPVWPALAHAFPPLALVRYPEKHLALFAFGAAWLAALALARFAPLLRPRLRAVALAAAALAFVAERDRAGGAAAMLSRPELLARPPALLSAVPPRAPGAPPPRVFSLAEYTGYPPMGLDMRGLLDLSLASIEPEYGSLFGAAYVFPRDYDLLLPRRSFEWELFLHRAIPAGSPLVPRLLRTVGTEYVADVDRATGRPRLLPVRDPLPPFRFARRLVADPDARRLLRRALAEGFEPGTAYLATSDAPVPSALSPGRVRRVYDGPGALVVDVESAGPAPSFLLLYRRHDALAQATLDGRPCAVADVLLGFGGVTVPPGRHEVRLRPDTRSVTIGALMSLVSALALGVFLVRPRRARGPA